MASGRRSARAASVPCAAIIRHIKAELTRTDYIPLQLHLLCLLVSAVATSHDQGEVRHSDTGGLSEFILAPPQKESDSVTMLVSFFC